MEVSKEVKVAIVKRNLQAVSQQLYDLELNARAATRIGDKQRVASIEGDIKKLLAVQDVFNEELNEIETAQDESGEGPEG